MPSRRRLYDEQSNFDGGLRDVQNTLRAWGRVKPNELGLAQNVRIRADLDGLLEARFGSKATSAAALGPGKFNGGMAWYGVSPVQNLAFPDASSPNNFVTSTSSSIPFTWTTHANTLANPSASAGPFYYMSLAPFRDASANVVYIADGGKLNKWDGTTLTENIAATPNVSVLAVYNNRLFGTGDTANPSALYWSGLGNGDTLGDAANGGGTANILTFGQQDIKALLPLGTSLLIFHRAGISIFTGWSQDDFSIASGTRGLAPNIAIASSSVTSFNNVGYFLTVNGAYQVTESGVELISEPLGDTISTALGSSTNLHYSYLSFRAFYHEIWFQIGGLFLVYNVMTRGWTAWTTAVLNGALWVDDSRLAIGGGGGGIAFATQGGFVWVVDDPSLALDAILSDGTGGNAINYQFASRPFFTRNATYAPRFLYLSGTWNGTLTPTLMYHDEAGSDLALPTISAQASGVNARGQASGLGRGPVSVKIDTTSYFQLDSLALEAFPYPRRF